MSCWRCFTAGMSFWRPPSVRKTISVTCRSGVLGHGPALAEQSRRVARRLISSDPRCAVDDLKALRETLGEAGFQAPGQGKWLFRWVVCIPRCAQCSHGRYCFQLISVDFGWKPLRPRRWIGRCWQLLPLCCALAALPQWNSSRAAIASSHWWMRLGL